MKLSWSQEVYIKAYQFAAHAHNGQSVTGTNLPYIMHPTFVGMEVMAALTVENVSNPDLAIQCALLHDVIEDTPVTYQQLKAEFGIAVSDGVQALSKNKELDKCDQMDESLARIMQQPKEIWMVKLADRITNLQQPPSDWTNGRKLYYRDEAIRINENLHVASPCLGNRLQKKIDHYSFWIKS
jgi:(p)ppGpp synthase/HD superfamily hydrolase